MAESALRLIIDPAAAVPPYEQIRTQLAAMVGDGRLPAGTRLPTVRQLAGELGLAVNTVARSYHELEQAGLVLTRGRHGTVVASGRSDATERLRQLAERYANTSQQLGVPPDAALDLVRAALGLVQLPGGGARRSDPS